MKHSNYFFLLVINLFLILPLAKGQHVLDSTKLFQIKTVDGNEYLGNIQSEDSLKISLLTSRLGTLEIPRGEIIEIIRIESKRVKAGKVWFENPQSSRYFWSPNGYGLRKGEGYYQNIWVLWNQASIGITNRISIGAGMIPLFLFTAPYTPVWVVPKISIPVVKDKFNIGLGAFVGGILGEDATGFGILYGSGTIGNRDNNFTFGLGYGYAGGELAKRPIVNISMMTRVSSKTYLLSENYYLNSGGDELVLLSFGARSFSRSLGIDYGLFAPISESFRIAIPWLGITVPFGKASTPSRSISHK